MNRKQYSFTEMSRKTVINVADGRELGHVCDMIFNNCGGVIGFVVPGKKSFFKSITSSDNVFIPWNRIIKIGSDVILVELVGNTARSFSVDTNAHDVEVESVAYDKPQTANAYSAPSANTYAQQVQGDYPQNQDAYNSYNCPQNPYSQASAADIQQSNAQTVYHDTNRR